MSLHTLPAFYFCDFPTRQPGAKLTTLTKTINNEDLAKFKALLASFHLTPGLHWSYSPILQSQVEKTSTCFLLGFLPFDIDKNKEAWQKLAAF